MPHLVQRKRDAGVLTALAVAFVLPAGGGIFTWLRVLDWPTLRGGNPAAFERLLTQQQRTEFVAGLHTTALYKDGDEKSTCT